jgi:hypothetical protein
LFGDAQLGEARNFAKPINSITSCNRSLDFGVKKYVIFQYADIQYAMVYAFEEILAIAPSVRMQSEIKACSKN